jgi:O-antigen/teichoic acid export membrane protein
MSLKKNTAWNLFGAGAPLIVGAFTIPYLITALGIEAFGVLTLIWALIGYFSLFDFGLGRALTQQIAAMRSIGAIDQIPRRMKAGLVFTAITGLAGGVLLIALAPLLSQSWLNISVGLQKSALVSFVIAAIGIPLTTVSTGLRGVLEAYEDFKVANILRVILGILNFALPALIVAIFGPILEYAAAGLLFARILVTGLHFVWVNKKLSSHWLHEKYEPADIKSLWQFGLWMTVSNVVGPLMVTADRFIISSVLGAAFVAYYTVPFEVLIRILIIPGALTAALFPRVTALLTVDLAGAKKIYSKSIAVVGIVMIPILLAVGLGAHFWLSIWISPEFADMAWLTTAILAVGIGFNGVAQLPHAAIQATGNAKLTAIIHSAELILYIPLLFVALKYFGMTGAACVWVVRAAADFFVMRYFVNKIFAKS